VEIMAWRARSTSFILGVKTLPKAGAETRWWRFLGA
jgi:hypothetical protein